MRQKINRRVARGNQSPDAIPCSRKWALRRQEPEMYTRRYDWYLGPILCDDLRRPVIDELLSPTI